DQHTFPWMSIAFTLFGLLLLVLGKQLWTDYQAKKAKAKELSLEERTIQNLYAIDSQNLPAKGEYKKFYTQLTQQIRSYIEQKYHLPVTTETTEEFLQAAAQKPEFQPSFKELISQFLINADQIKFADKPADQQECKQAYESALQLIR